MLVINVAEPLVATASSPKSWLYSMATGQFIINDNGRTSNAEPSAYSAYSPVANGQQFVDSQSFADIGHSLWAVIIAFAGGITAQLLAKDRKQVGVVKGGEGSAA